MATLPKVEDLDYIQFLFAAQTAFSCNEAARCSGVTDDTPAHDAFTRLLARRPPDIEALWREVEPFVNKTSGLLIIDDSTLDKPHARFMDLVGWHWSGKHKATVRGINLTSLVWTDGGTCLPIDCRVYDKPTSGLDKNDYFRAMITTAKERGFTPEYVSFDGWYSGLDNLKHLRDLDWRWLTRLKSNRQVDPDRTGNVNVENIEIGDEGRIVHLKGYGMVKVFRIVTDFDEADHWATDDLSLTEANRQELARQAFAIENYHRALKQYCAVEKCQARSAVAQKNHILFSLRTFVRLEVVRLRTRVSWQNTKLEIIRDAVRQRCRAGDLLRATCA
jgi:putative transposase